MERTRAEAAAIATDGLPTEDRITRDMLEVIAELQIEEDDQRLHQLRVVDQMGGPQQLLPQLTQFQPADTPERLEAFLARLHAYPAFMAANTEILRDGLASGLTAPRIVAERTIAQIERMLDVPIESAIVPSMVKVATEADRERVRDVVRDVVYPADRRVPRRARAATTWPATREDPASGRRPTASQLYRTAIRSWTTLDLDPEEVHRIGLDELESIEAERREIARGAGFGDDTAAYRAALDADPANTPADQGRARRPRDRGHRAGDGDRAALLRRPAAGRLRGPPGRGVQGEGRAVRLLLPAGARRLAAGDLLRQRLRPAEPQVHQAGDDDLPRGGARPPLPDHASRWRTRTSTPSAASGRGWSAAPTSRAGACTASGSPTRWACSATRRERFGMLDAQAWRAARLVVDTGLHALRWPRQRSIDFLRAAGLSETDAVIETDRYICWPGQALTYKIGQREIERLRAELAARDGSRVRPAGLPRRASSATARCRSRRSAASSRTGWRRPV